MFWYTHQSLNLSNKVRFIDSSDIVYLEIPKSVRNAVVIVLFLYDTPNRCLDILTTEYDIYPHNWASQSVK